MNSWEQRGMGTNKVARAVERMTPASDEVVLNRCDTARTTISLSEDDMDGVHPLSDD